MCNYQWRQVHYGFYDSVYSELWNMNLSRCSVKFRKAIWTSSDSKHGREGVRSKSITLHPLLLKTPSQESMFQFVKEYCVQDCVKCIDSVCIKLASCVWYNVSEDWDERVELRQITVHVLQVRVRWLKSYYRSHPSCGNILCYAMCQDIIFRSSLVCRPGECGRLRAYLQAEEMVLTAFI